MTTSFEQRLIDACNRFLAARDQFVTDLLAVARDASVEAVERAFALASAKRSRSVSEPRNEESATAAVAPPLPVPTPALVTATDVPPEPASSELTVPSMSNTDRVLACIRQTPGSHVGQLSRTLSMPASTVRRHVRTLAAREAIRIQGTSGPWWGQPRRTFFPCELNVDIESSASAPEASV